MGIAERLERVEIIIAALLAHARIARWADVPELDERIDTWPAELALLDDGDKMATGKHPGGTTMNEQVRIGT